MGSAGIHAEPDGTFPSASRTLNVTSSTIIGNDGGSISLFRGTLNVSNSTIIGSVSVGPTSAFGTWTVKSSIVSHASSGAFTSGGFNLIGDPGHPSTSTGFTNGVNNDQVGTTAAPLDPKLDPAGLQNNGGPTQTIALLSDSPAIDKGTGDGLTGTLTNDQRGSGFPRTIDDPDIPPATGGDDTDIGAFELQPPPVNAGNALLINESCPPANGAIDPGERVTVNLGLMNTSNAATSILVATLRSSGGILAPSGPQSFGAINPNGSAARDFSFTADGSLNPGQTITVTLQLQDGANNLGTVSFNFTAGPAPCSFVRLVVNSSLSRADASTVVGEITVQNIGSLAADNVTLITARLGGTNGTPLPQGLGNLAPGESATVMVNFSNSTPGSSSMLTLGGTYSGGNFSSNKRLTIP